MSREESCSLGKQLGFDSIDKQMQARKNYIVALFGLCSADLFL